MMEKRSLQERVAEAPNVPVVKVPKPQPVTVHQVSPLDSKKKQDRAEEEKKAAAAAASAAPTTEVARAKRKSGRRRVVELSRDDTIIPNGGDGDNHSVRTLVRSPTNPSSIRSQPVPAPKKYPVDIEMNPHEEASSGAESSPPPSLPDDKVDWSIRGDEYRRKVEALKNEVGSGWLSVLSEEGLSLASTRKGSPASPPTGFHGGNNAYSGPR